MVVLHGSIGLFLLNLSLILLPWNGVRASFDVNSVDRVIQEVFGCSDNPGLTVSVVKDGKTLFAKGYGVTDLERRNDVNSTTLFNVASLTKNMAAALVIKLLNEKTDYTVDSKVRDILGNDFQLMDEYRSHETTVADMLGHRTALPPNNILRFDDTLTRKGLLGRLKYLDSPDPFRVKYYYSNLMYGLATYMAEVLGEAPWERLVTEHFLKPLGMDKTTFVTEVDFSREDMVWPYVKDENNSLSRVPFEHSRRWGLLAGSVALVTTAEDMTKWMNFHLSGGKDDQGRQVMPGELLNLLYQPRMVLPEVSVLKRHFSKPSMPFTWSRDSYMFGLRAGWYRGYRRYSHSGSNHGYRALLTLLPTENIGVFVAMNGRDDDYRLRIPLQMYLIDLALGLKPWLNASTICSYPAPWVEEGTNNSSENCPKIKASPLKYETSVYEGEFHHKAYGSLAITFNDTLQSLVLQYGWATWQLIPQSFLDGPELFYAKGVELTADYNLNPIEFVQDGNGRMSKIIATGFEPNSPPEFKRPQVVQSTQTDKPEGRNTGLMKTPEMSAWFNVLLVVLLLRI